MRHPGVGAMVVAGCVAAARVGPAAPPPGYELVWADEFDGAGVNTNEWNPREGRAHLSRCDRKWVSVAAGPVAIELVDTSRYYARCDRLLLTTDPAYTPTGRGGLPNVVHSRSENPGGAREP